MGRFYQDQAGNEGKFWFAVQPSDDPETVYDMQEIPPEEVDEEDDSNVVFYDTDDSKHVAEKLNEQYDILGVPPEERKFDFANRSEALDYVWDDLFKYYLTYDESEAVRDKHGNLAMYGIKDKTAFSKGKELELAASRVDLGLFILMSIKQNGNCFITAEW